MRPDIKLLLLVNGIILLVILYQVKDLITLLHDDSFSDAILEKDAHEVIYTKDLSTGELKPDRELLIPKIIHQTYKTEEVPEKWKEMQKSVMDNHPDYKYILWTDEMAEDFIAKEYPWFLPTYQSYPFPIQRADVIRYFILYHFGGIYVDLDNGSRHKFDPLLAFPAWLRKTEPTGVSNDIMGSIPNHPFFGKVIDNLKKYNINYFVPYLTIMYSTGPLFLSVMWKQFKRWGVPPGGEVRIVFPADSNKPRTNFFLQVHGSSWHVGDAQFIFFMGDHWPIFVVIGFVLAFLVFYLQLKFYQSLLSGSFFTPFRWLYRKIARKGARGSYELLPKHVDDLKLQ